LLQLARRAGVRPFRDLQALSFAQSIDVGYWQILLQMSFWGVERKFLEPLVRFARGDLRDHIG
jgi:hypothetical protein